MKEQAESEPLNNDTKVKIVDPNENNNNNSKENKTSMVPKIIMLVVGIAVAGGIGSILEFRYHYSVKSVTID